jgi:hypothetical protein
MRVPLQPGCQPVSVNLAMAAGDETRVAPMTLISPIPRWWAHFERFFTPGIQALQTIAAGGWL